MLRVLVVGPDNLSGDLGPTVLGRPDIERIHLEDTAAAVDVCGRARPTLVLVDLPHERASALVRELRADARSRHCAIAWMNRSDPPEVEAALVACGANAAIPLPIDPQLWDRRLEELVSVPPRRSYRIPVRLRDWSQFLRGTDEADAFVLNIGARGVLLETERELEPGSKLGLTFRLPGEPRDVAVVGQVVRFAGHDAGLYRAGIEFLVYRGDARERIARFVESDPDAVRPGAPASALPLTVRPFEEALEWEEELRASEIRKALILDSALDCIVTADHEGRIVEFNAAARRLFGYSRAEVLGREIVDTIVPPERRSGARRRLRDLTLSGDTRDMGEPRETEAMRADGTLVPVQVFVFPAYVKGRLLLTAYIRDLTESKREQRLAAARQRAVRTLAVSLSLAEAAPAVLDAVVSGLDCDEARLWLLESPERLALAATSTAREPGSAPGEALARRALERASATWERLPGGGAALAVPMRLGGQTLGAVEARSARLQQPDERWPELVADVASQLGLFLERQRAEAELQRFARYDGLTGLPNRSFFRETLHRTLARAARERSRLALIFIDLDGFKAVNDGLGHAAGDAVLQLMAERLRAGVRSSDVIARFGGDEFVVLLPNMPRGDDAALVARALLDRVSRPSVVDGHDIALGASAGISVFPDDGQDANELLRAADLAMYRAKQEGRNTYRYFTSEMSDRALERMALLDGLRQALDRQEFELVYLPVFDGGLPVALEALLRWRHPKLGLVPPAAFIAEAEESGLILPLGVRVLRVATRFMASLPGTTVRLVVNLSQRQFQEPHLVETIRQTLEVSGLAPERLELDLTPATVMNDAEGVLDRLRRLRELGVGLSLDDFGTAAFSIPRLRALGLRALKIDRSLVSRLPDSPEHVLQVEAVLALARTLQIDAAAEGVETEAQRRFLDEHGCARLQGYLLSRPLDQADVADFLARGAAVR